jgi:protein-tyrosine-phosphatase
MTQHVIIFVCEHGAAKSILAAAYFNKLAQEKHLSAYALARGTHPDAELSSKTIVGLQEDGLTPTEAIPIKLTREETESAQQIVSFCDLPEECKPKGVIEFWQDVPPVSENYQISRDAILERIHKLIDRL